MEFFKLKYDNCDEMFFEDHPMNPVNFNNICCEILNEINQANINNGINITHKLIPMKI